MVTCPQCGASRGESDRFCADCGAPLGRCPSCGEPTSQGHRFCPACGHELGDDEYLTCYRGWLAALRRDATSAEMALGGVQSLRASEDHQDQSFICVVEAFTTAARGQQDEALRRARRTLAHDDVLGMGFESVRWAWPLAARAAHDPRDARTTSELLALLDSHLPGHIPPTLRAERNLAHARLAASDHGQTATASFAAAIASLRELSTPYHLAHGLLDYAEFIMQMGNADAAQTAIDEARDIAGRLRCQPLLDRAADLPHSEPRIRVPMVTALGPEESATARDR